MMTESIIDNPMQNYRRAFHRGIVTYVCGLHRKFKPEATGGKYYILKIVIFHEKKSGCFLFLSFSFQIWVQKVQLFYQAPHKKGKYHSELTYPITDDNFCEQNFLLMLFGKL